MVKFSLLAKHEKPPEAVIDVDESAPGTPGPGTPGSEQPGLNRSGSSFDFKTLRNFTKCIFEDRIDAAVKLMSEDVEWNAFDGRVIKGRAACKEMFETQKKLGQKRKAITDYHVLPKLREEDGFDEADLGSFRAQRIVAFHIPNAIPARVVQTMTLKKGQITKAVVESAPWEPGLEPLELLLRFASLRASKKDDLAVICLDVNCEWRQFDLPDIFKRPPDVKNPCEGRQEIKQLWDLQREQGVIRTALTEWTEEDGVNLVNMKPSLGGQVFSRQARICGKDGTEAKSQQTAQVANGYIVAVRHDPVQD